MEEVTVARTSDLPEGRGMVVDANGREIALFNIDGEFFAIDNACPHRGGSLGDGFVEGKAVACSMHGWQFDIASGKGVMPPDITLQVYDVEVRDDDVVVIIP